jgi:hypothetical protein
VRDRALLCFGFASGGRRRSEITAADLRDLPKIGEDGYASSQADSASALRPRIGLSGVESTVTPACCVFEYSNR